MSHRRWEVAGGIGGILFATLVIAGLVITRLPGGEDENRHVANHFADEGNRVLAYVSAFLLTLAGLALLLFIAGVWERLRRVDASPGGMYVLAFGCGLVVVAMLLLTAAALSSVAANVQQGGEETYGPDVARLAWIGTLALVICGGLAASAFVAATSAIMLNASVFPRWLAWAGFVAAVVLLGSVIFLPLIALPVWVVATGVVLLTSSSVTAPAAAR